MRPVFVLVLLLTLTACSSAPTDAGPSAAASSASGRTAGCAASPTTDPVDVAGQIGERGETDFGAVFAGARVGEEGVDVYRKASGAADFDRWVLADFAASCVLLHDARFSGAELAQRYQEVNDDNAYWASQGVTVNSVSSDFVRGVVVAGTSEADKARPLFAAKYAAGVPVEVVNEAPA